MAITIMSNALTNLRIHFLWPKKGQELNAKTSYYIMWAIVQLISSALPIGSILHLFVAIQIKSYNIFEDLSMIIAEIGAYYFLANFVYYQKQIALILVDLSNHKTFGKPPNFDANNATLTLLFTVYTRFVDVAVICFCLPTIFLKNHCLKQNALKKFPETCGILVTCWMPFDIENPPLNQVFYLLQCFTIVMTLRGAAMISGTICETMEHLIIRIKHMQQLLREAINTKDGRLREQRFEIAVNYHNFIYDIGFRMDDCFSGCLFLHVVFSGALFGFIGYQLMTIGLSLKQLALLVAWFNSMVIVSVSGQRLIDETLAVGDVAYDSDWYEREPRFQKKLILLLERCQNPLYIHAGPFSFLSHLLVLSILKTAYSYLTLLSATSA